MSTEDNLIKPHIERGSWLSISGERELIWRCFDPESEGWGTTLPKAYDDWLTHRKALRHLESVSWHTSYPQ